MRLKEAMPLLISNDAPLGPEVPSAEAAAENARIALFERATASPA